MSAKYVRNIQGTRVALELREVDPWAVKLDPTNPRIGFWIELDKIPDRMSQTGCDSRSDSRLKLWIGF